MIRRTGNVQQRAWCRIRVPLCVAIVVLLYVGTRLLGLDRSVTTDEPFWLGRSANFYRALRTGEFVHTYQMAHPGILTMWAGAAAFFGLVPDYADFAPKNLVGVRQIPLVLRAQGVDPLEVLVAAKVSKVLVQGVFFAIALAYVRRLFDPYVMLCAGTLIAFDPFLSGLDSALHVDGLFAITSLCGVLGIASATRSGHTAARPWAIAGILAACAWLTRSTGVLLVGVVLGVLLWNAAIRPRRRDDPRGGSNIRGFAVSGLIWGAAAAGTSVLLLPALWVDPSGTLRRTWEWSRDAAVRGHNYPTFFMGEIHRGDPGMLFYPVSLLWRLTPVALAGIVLLVGISLRNLSQRRVPGRTATTVAILAVFAAAYTAGMTLGSKKFDRYLLPVYPILDLLAAVGFGLLAGELARRRSWRGKVARPAVAGLLVIGQAAAVLSVLPYRLDYYNPLLGGAAGAQDVMQMGWGQGGDRAVAFIADDVRGDETVTMQATSVGSAFGYFLPDNIVLDSSGFGSPASWYETDYFVAGIQEWQRDRYPDYRLFPDHRPVHEVRIEGVPYFRIYTPKTLPLPDRLAQDTACSIDFGASIRLVQIVERGDMIDLYWTTTGTGAPPVANVSVRMTPSDPVDTGRVLKTSGTWVPGAEHLVSRVSVPNPAPEPGPTLDRYWVELFVADLVTGEALSPTRPRGLGLPGPATALSGCYAMPVGPSRDPGSGG